MNKLKIDQYFLQRFLNNKCTSEETEAFISHLGTNPGDAKLEQLFRQEWNTQTNDETDTTIDLELLLYKIHSEILERNFKSSSKPIVRKLFVYVSRIAAVLFIPLIVYTALNHNSGKEVVEEVPAITQMATPPGVKTTVSLPDGSKVWMNGGSTIQYPTHFSKKSREVQFSGEAYFDIAKNEQKPFMLNTGDINIKVMGTQFNVENYQDQSKITTTLVEGSIEMQRLFPDGEIKTLTLLKPNQQLTYNKDNKKAMLSSDVNTYKYIAWLDNRVVFDNDPLHAVFSKLERVYNIDVEMNEAELAKYSFTATFEQESFEQIIELIKLAVPISYTKEEIKQNEDRSFSRKIYHINLKK